ncbi:MAG: Retinol dehydrogenase 13 [Candidatus Saccharicenans subterraneus]|uniref:Retinol dehydrogenase 13 n=1 Tax=Candidatus Saccharicenans subterraneus TaxID=2508984 RepID=A0A3E2BLL3_9BACT|nr:MAG: Retinol dehydrogenase 13 [Candidatus Saccharicenans subterraneum]
MSYNIPISMSQKTCLITGATSGIGRAAAMALARQGFRVIIVARNKDKAEATCRRIRQVTRNEAVSWYLCDLSLLRDVQALASQLRNDLDSLDVLINNAGARFLRHQLTPEGIELTLATNHLGHFVLTLSLLDLLERSAEARIINVASGAHYGADGVIENILRPEEYDGKKQYARSKLANVLFTYALAERLKDRQSRITVNAADPGGVATNFARNNGLIPWLKHRLYYLSKRQLLSPARGAEIVVYLASSPEVRGATGKYFFEKKERRSSAASYDIENQRKLWELSQALSGLGH